MSQRGTPSLPYEILRYEAAVELYDVDGRRAVYNRRELIKFLHDGVSSLDDYGWGNGIAFAGHDVSPGKLVKRRIVGSRLRSTVQLPKRYHKGDLLTFWVDRLIENGFTGPSECWLEAELYHVTERLSLKVILPPERLVRGAHLVRPGVPGGVGLPTKTLRDGRQTISYEARRPALGSRYTVVWDW